MYFVAHWCTCPSPRFGLINRILDKMAAILQTTFSNAFSWMKSFLFDLKFTEVCSQGSNWQYRQFSNIRHTQTQNTNVSRLALLLSLPNPLKPCVKLRMKMQLEQRQQAMPQLHLNFIANLGATYIRDFTLSQHQFSAMPLIADPVHWCIYIYIYK